jgi:von Willebrand factor type D domain/Peptidase of plants and bacteria
MRRRSRVGSGTARRTVLLTAALAAAAVAAPPARAADDGVLPARADVPGFAAAGSGSKVARTALGRPATKSLRGAPVRGAAFRSGKRRLWFAVYTASSAKKATRALRELGAKRKGLAKARRAKGIGDRAVLRLGSSRKQTDATLLLREGRAVAAVRFRVPGRARPFAAAAARAYAKALVERLRRVLALTAYERTLDGISTDGTVGPQLALRAFAIAYGAKIPGVTVPRGPLGVPESGTEAINLVDGVWAKLTDAQKAAVDRTMGRRHDPASPPLARSAKGGTLTEDAALEQKAQTYYGFFAARLPAPPTPMRVYRSAQDFGPLAETTQVNGDYWGFGEDHCEIVIAPKGAALEGQLSFEYVVAHEVFHCFQYGLYDGSRPDWLIEGMADWAGLKATGFQQGSHYRTYLKTPTKHLFTRGYDASGFWGRAEEVGGVDSLWAKIPAILAAPASSDEFALAGGDALGFTTTWASAPWRLKNAGAAWRQALPYAVSTSEVPVTGSAVTGDALLSSPHFATAPYAVVADPSRPLVEVLGNEGFLRAATDDQDFGLVGGQSSGDGWFCFGKCECPDGAGGSLPPSRQVDAGALALALTWGRYQGKGQVAYHALDEFCDQKEPDPPDGPAETNGDPHLTSLDGLHFDFQAAGEFWLVRSRSGDLRIQARQEPYEKSTRVTVNTQLAMGIGGARVTVGPGAAASDPPVVRVGGAPVALGPGARLPVGAGSVTRAAQGGSVEITWPDGSRVEVRAVGRWGVAARIALASARRRTVSGLLGDFDGSPSDDLADRKGRRIGYRVEATDDWGFLRRFHVADEFEPKFFDALYDDVGDAWRISRSESLLDYGPGESTKTFTNRKLPSRPVDPGDVSGRADAERSCRARGVTEPGPLADCIVDLAATGNTAFADDAAAAQEAALVDWSPLAAGAGLRGPASLLETPDGALHIGLRTAAAVDVPLDAAGNEGAAEAIGAADDPWLLAAPGGGVRALTADVLGGAEAGIYQLARAGPGAWTPLGPVTTGGSSYVARPNGLLAPDGTLFTVSPMAGVARVFRGAGAVNPGVEPTAALPDCFASEPAIARDEASGTLWMAWVQWDCPQQGVFAQQIDAATGAPVGAALQAPGSAPSAGEASPTAATATAERLALTGRPGAAGVYLAYVTDRGARVRLWRVGDASATAISGRKGARDALLAAEPAGGRMWLAWTEDGRLLTERTTPAGVPDGGLRAIPAPGADVVGPGLRHWAIAARAGALDVVYGHEASGAGAGSVWHARLRP